jgi:lactoylglutathione lyase
MTGRELAAAEGVAALHRWEADHLLRSLDGPTPAVVAAAASTLDDARCLAALRAPIVVGLTAPGAVLAARMAAAAHEAEAGGADDARRPLGPEPAHAITALDDARSAALAKVADAVVDTADDRPSDTLAAVEAALAGLPPGAVPTSSRVSHVGICVSDMERSLRFYRDGLGFEPTHDYRIGPEFSALMEVEGVELHSQFLRRGGVTIELLHFAEPGQSGDGTRRPINRLGISHLSVRVEDVSAAAARLEQVGGTVLRGTRTTFGEGDAAMDFVYCTDPDGTRVELMHLPEA